MRRALAAARRPRERPRQAGKTTLLLEVQRATGGTYVSLDEDASFEAARADPVGFIAAYPRPLSIDEVQLGAIP